MREIRAAGIVLLLASAIAACQSASTASLPAPATDGPDASSEARVAAATPSATPRPVDVAALAMARLADRTLRAKVTIDATTTVGRDTITTTAALEIDGLSSHLLRTDATGRSKTRVETIVAGGVRYGLEKGVWVRLGDADAAQLPTILRTTTLIDLGEELRGSVTLHHLRSTPLATAPTELVLATAGGASDVATTIDAWVRDDGTPVTATLTSTWTQGTAKETVAATRTASLAFEPLGRDVAVAAPEPWAFFISTRNGYRIGYPADWAVKPGSATLADGFAGGSRYVYASRAHQKNVDLAYLAKRMPGELASITGYAKISVDRVVKAKLDGVAARRVEWHGTFDGKRVYGQAIVTVKGAWWYFLGMEQLAKTDAASRSLFGTLIGTFDFR